MECLICSFTKKLLTSLGGTFFVSHPTVIMKIKSYIERLFTIRSETIANPLMRRVVRFIRLMVYMLRSLLSHNTMLRSDALTYYTLISIVPILALAFAIVNGFGMIEGLIENLYSLLPTMPELVDLIVDFAHKALARTRGGLVAVVSIAMLFWSVISMFNSIESAFDNIWEVKRGRSIVRRVSNYITIFVVAPLLWVLSSYVGSFMTSILSAGNSLSFMLLSKVAALALAWAMFTFLFIILPNTKVHFRPACLAGIVTAIFFLGFQWLYVWLQSMMTSYNAIYGSFAALPLFLLWVKISWQILLLGGELSFAVQNEKTFDEELEAQRVSYTSRRAVALAVMYEVCGAFRKGKGGMAVSTLSNRLSLTPRLLNQTLTTLCEAGLLHEIERETDNGEEFFSPARDLASLHLYDILQAVDDAGYGKEEVEAPAIKEWSRRVELIRSNIRSEEYNPLLTEIIDQQYGK